MLAKLVSLIYSTSANLPTVISSVFSPHITDFHLTSYYLTILMERERILEYWKTSKSLYLLCISQDFTVAAK